MTSASDSSSQSPGCTSSSTLSLWTNSRKGSWIYAEGKCRVGFLELCMHLQKATWVRFRNSTPMLSPPRIFFRLNRPVIQKRDRTKNNQVTIDWVPETSQTSSPEWKDIEKQLKWNMQKSRAARIDFFPLRSARMFLLRNCVNYVDTGTCERQRNVTAWLER